MQRHDPQNTGEYGKIREPVLILASTSWNEADPCGNIIVQKGTLTIPSGKMLSLTDKASKIIVQPGASLVVDGGSLTLKNGGKIQLRNGGKVTVDLGASFSNLNGSID